MTIKTNRVRRLLGVSVASLALVAGLTACSDDSGETHSEAMERLGSESAQAEAMLDSSRGTSDEDPQERLRDQDADLDSSDSLESTSEEVSGIPGFSVEAVDAAADGSLETKPIERNDASRDLAASVPTPGITLGYVSGGSDKGCTLGFVGNMDGNLVGVTAGHCNEEADSSSVDWYPNGGSVGNTLGTFDSDFCVTRETCGDYGLVDIDDSLGYDGEIAGMYEISGVMDPSGLTPNMELCKYGRVTGESCGKLMMREGNRGWAAMTSYQGDSGAPVYAKNSDGTAKLVGVLNGSPQGSNGATVDQVSSFTFATAAIDGLGLDKIYG